MDPIKTTSCSTKYKATLKEKCKIGNTRRGEGVKPLLVLKAIFAVIYTTSRKTVSPWEATSRSLTPIHLFLWPERHKNSNVLNSCAPGACAKICDFRTPENCCY